MALRISNRDYDLLRYLGAQGVATAEQLAESYFPNRETCLRRLSYLKQGGLVESVRIAELKTLSQASFNQAVHILGLSRSEKWKYRVYRLSPRLRSRKAGAESLAAVRMWKHQIELNGVRSLLESLLPGALILTDPEIRAEWRRIGAGADAPISDLLIRLPHREIAVELERNLKSEAEYFTRFLRYESGSFTHVLYFCESDEVFNKVSELSKRIPKIGVAQLLNPEVIFRKEEGYSSLKSFLGME